MRSAGLPRPEQDAERPILVKGGQGGTRRDNTLHHHRKTMDGLSRMGQSGENDGLTVVKFKTKEMGEFIDYKTTSIEKRHSELVKVTERSSRNVWFVHLFDQFEPGVGKEYFQGSA